MIIFYDIKYTLLTIKYFQSVLNTTKQLNFPWQYDVALNRFEINLHTRTVLVVHQKGHWLRFSIKSPVMKQEIYESLINSRNPPPPNKTYSYSIHCSMPLLLITRIIIGTVNVASASYAVSTLSLKWITYLYSVFSYCVLAIVNKMVNRS